MDTAHRKGISRNKGISIVESAAYQLSCILVAAAIQSTAPHVERVAVAIYRARTAACFVAPHRGCRLIVAQPFNSGFRQNICCLLL